MSVELNDGNSALVCLMSLVVAAVLVAPVASASPPPAETLSNGMLAPPHSDHGVDADGDSEFDFLAVDVNVTVTVPGAFFLVADLVDPIGGSTIDSRVNMTVLGPGPQTIPVWFSGTVIRAAGINGPYNVNMILVNDSFTPLDMGVHVTAPYLWIQFESPNAQFWPPHLDFGEDLDSDTFFDNLVLQVVLNVSLTGQYSVDGYLYDGTGMTVLGSASFSGPLGTGLQVVDLRFGGFLIFSSGIDGPYKAELTLTDTSGFLDNDTHMTQPYLYTSFESTGGAVLNPPYSDYGVDTDADTLFDWLVVEIPLNVTESGSYWVDGALFDGAGMNFIASLTNSSFFMPGNSTIQLWFQGYTIRNSGFDGPYVLEISLWDAMMLLDNDTYITNSYLSTDFDLPPAQFAPPHSDYGVDVNADTLFDYLVVNVTLNVDSASFFSVSGDLYDGLGTVLISSQTNDTPLTAGLHVVQLWFPGFTIRNSGIDGPYYVSLYLYEGVSTIDFGSHVTGPYLYTEFQTPPMYFNPPHSDYGLDTDSDSLFDFLVINASVFVNVSGTYEITGSLYDLFGIVNIDTQMNVTFLSNGAGTVQLRFPGLSIRQSGVNGPYSVELTAGQTFNVIDTDTYITAPYLYTEFRAPPAVFGTPHSDFGLDTDFPADGLFNYLVVNVTVDVNEAGEYLVEGVLMHPAIPNGLIAVNMTDLDVGTQVVQLRFDGKILFSSGADGSFNVMLLLGIFDQSGLNLLDMDGYITSPYMHTDFQSANPGTLWGRILEAGSGIPISSGQIMVFSFANHLALSTSTDFTGYYSVPVYEGDFFVTADDSTHQAEGLSVSVSGMTEASMVLGQMPPNDLLTSVVFSDWDNVNITTSVLLQQDNQTNRAMIDLLLGNGDGYVNSSEISRFLSVMGMSPSMPGSSMDLMYVDGIHYDLVPGSDGMQVNDAGAVWTKAPIELSLMGDYVSNTPIPAGMTHLLKVNVTLDTDGDANVLFADVPATYYLQSYDPVSDVTVGGVGTRNIVIDPRRNPGAPLPYVWVNLTIEKSPDSAAPEISGVLVDGQPSMTYYLSTLPATALLTATVDDTATGGSQISGANYTTPGATSWPGTAMSATDGAFDEVSEAVEATIPIPSTPGTYLYYVHAWDAVFNANDSAPYVTITVVDDLRPQIQNVRVDGLASVTYYLSNLPANIVLTALVDDSPSGGTGIGGANYTRPTATSWPGIAMSAADGAFDESSEDVTATISTPAIPGTHRYYVHAWDAALNMNDTAPFATVIIVDDLAPLLSQVRVNGQTSISVLAGTIVYFNATADDTTTGGSNIAGANHTIGLAQWPGTPMAAVDGAFNSATEAVTAQIDTAGWTVGTYQTCAYAWDTAQGEDASVQACAQIDIYVDSDPPSVSQVRLSGQTSVTTRPGATFVLTAAVSDVSSGNSDIAGANYTEGLAQWPGTPMTAADGSFDSPLESVTATVDTTGWTDGTHRLCVYAWDSAGMRNTTSTACADVVIDGTPPAISGVAATPDPQVSGQDVEISASVTDAGGSLPVSVEIRDPSGTPVGNYSMDYDSVTQKFAYSSAYSVVGTYTYRIWAHDAVGNYAHSDGDFEITQPATPPQASFIEQYWWALLLVVVAVVALLVFFMMRRKKQVTAPEVDQTPPVEQTTGESPQQPAPPPPMPPPPPPQPEQPGQGQPPA